VAEGMALGVSMGGAMVAVCWGVAAAGGAQAVSTMSRPVTAQPP